MEKRRQPEIIAGRVGGDGSILSGDGFTAVKNAGVGSYTVTLPGGFRLMSFVASPSVPNNYVAAPSTPAGQQMTVQMYVANTAAGVDAAFSFIAVGVQT